jgi:hypothetical protein
MRSTTISNRLASVDFVPCAVLDALRGALRAGPHLHLRSEHSDPAGLMRTAEQHGILGYRMQCRLGVRRHACLAGYTRCTTRLSVVHLDCLW